MTEPCNNLDTKPWVSLPNWHELNSMRMFSQHQESDSMRKGQQEALKFGTFQTLPRGLLSLILICIL